MVSAVRVAVGATIAGATSCASGSTTAQLVVEQDVPADVRTEIDVTWNRFVDRFAARHACLGDVSVLLVREVEGGDARYVAADHRIEIEIPTTPERFRESLAHELAHHVERTCAEFAELRDALLRQLGGPRRAWSVGPIWAEIPSEVWAEGVVEIVNGERVRHADEIPIDPRIIGLIGAWADGEAPTSVG